MTQAGKIQGMSPTQCVLTLSVYNALSYSREDMTVDELVAFLQRNWTTQESPAAALVTPDAVTAALLELESAGWATFDREAKLGSILRREDGTGVVRLHRPQADGVVVHDLVGVSALRPLGGRPAAPPRRNPSRDRPPIRGNEGNGGGKP